MEKQSDNLYKCPKMSEYLQNIHEIQQRELKSERFEMICAFLNANYWRRFNIALEEELFDIVDTNEIEDELTDKTNEYMIYKRLKRYARLKNFIKSLSEQQIKSNIFLKSAKECMEVSMKDCINLFDELLIQISNSKFEEGKYQNFVVTCDIPQEREEIIPLRIKEEDEIDYYRPQDYKTSYVNVLDRKHQYIYENYNECVDKLNKLAQDIYFLQMNMISFMYPEDIFSYDFQIYNSSSHKFIVSFYAKQRKKRLEFDPETMMKDAMKQLEDSDKKSILKEELNITDDFIETTVANYYNLLELGLIDYLDEPSKEMVKRKQRLF